jgi:hypothetical protein
MVSEMMAVLDPTAGAKAKDIPIAPRLEDLNGKVIGLLWNTKPNGDILLRRIAERLCKKYHLSNTIWRQKPGAAMSAGPIIQEFSETVDAVVNALGD